MTKSILAAASHYKRARYFNEEYTDLPTAVRDELQAACSLSAEAARGIVTVGFYGDGTVFVEAEGAPDDHNYDEIGARLIVDSMLDEKAELFRALRLWYAAFRTEEGKTLLQNVDKA